MSNDLSLHGTQGSLKGAGNGSGHQSFTAVPLDFNWNTEPHPLSPIPTVLPSEPTPFQAARVEMVSECLRDGLHGVEVYPSVEDMLRYIGALSAFGIHRGVVGIYSGEDNSVSMTIKSLLRSMRDDFPSFTPLVLCLATPASLKWTATCKDINPRLEAIIFMGTAPSRRLAQGWELDFILRQLGRIVGEAVQLGIPVIGATEHTTQTPPDDLRQLIQVQVEQGAYSFGLADTIGIVRPQGAYRIVRFARSVLDEMGAQNVKVEWHGHRDMGNALANSLSAITAGAEAIHVVARGIGERAGNTPLEDVALNITAILEEVGQTSRWDMSRLMEVLSLYENIVAVPTPFHGTLGRRYNHTTLGIHADALLKAHLLAEQSIQAGDYETAQKLQTMARRIYSAIDPKSLGEDWSIGVSPWSGQNTIRLAYIMGGGNLDHLSTETIDRVLTRAKTLGRELKREELGDLFVQSVKQESLAI
jgi:isopropylmalate/homocitrate/citramalate synthase